MQLSAHAHRSSKPLVSVRTYTIARESAGGVDRFARQPDKALLRARCCGPVVSRQLAARADCGAAHQLQDVLMTAGPLRVGPPLLELALAGGKQLAGTLGSCEAYGGAAQAACVGTDFFSRMVAGAGCGLMATFPTAAVGLPLFGVYGFTTAIIVVPVLASGGALFTTGDVTLLLGAGLTGAEIAAATCIVATAAGHLFGHAEARSRENRAGRSASPGARSRGLAAYKLGAWTGALMGVAYAVYSCR